jgi:hypothetical protein
MNADGHDLDIIPFILQHLKFTPKYMKTQLGLLIDFTNNIC